MHLVREPFWHVDTHSPGRGVVGAWPCQICYSNRYTTHTLQSRQHGEVLDMGVIRDERVRLEAAFTVAAKGADVVITSGRVSVDPADQVCKFRAQLGQGRFRQLAMTPVRDKFQRGILSRDDAGEWTVKPTGNQSSSILSSMSLADCFIVLPETQGNVDPGTSVQVQLMHGFG